MESGPNSVFCFDWLNVSKDGKCSLIECNYYWAAHPGDGFWSGEFPDNFIHEWRLPYPTNIKKDKEFILKEIRFLHFGTYNAERTSNKLKFYQVSSLHGAMQGRNTKYNFVNLYRQYHSEAPSFGNWTNLPGDAFDYYEQNGINILSEINITDAGEHYVTEILRYFKEDGVSKYAMLDIWDDDFVLKSGLKDPRTVLDRMLLSYLKISNKYRNNVVIKVLDKLIGKVF